ncbi:MAG: hypothetical protein AAGG53_02430 [Cyanobacteria bacterium P01_H01_bin.152]
MISPQSSLHILGHSLKAFVIGVFALLVGCTIVATLGASSVAWAILTSLLPFIGRVGLTLVLAITINVIVESFR